MREYEVWIETVTYNTWVVAYRFSQEEAEEVVSHYQQASPSSRFYIVARSR